jgi:LysM repeat protein
MVRYDIFKHLYDILPACRPQVLDFSTRVLINRRTGVRSNVRTKSSLRWEIVMVGHDLRHEPSLRLTRRGRAVVLVLLVLAASLASVVLFTTASNAEQLPSTAPPAIVVQRGDTLWDIAARIMPGRDVHAGVEKIRQVNDLRGYVVREGEFLILPFGQ